MDDTPDSELPASKKADSRLTEDGVVSELPTTGSSFYGRQIVASRYEIFSRLGKGGMGEVWHAYDLKLRVDVAHVKSSLQTLPDVLAE